MDRTYARLHESFSIEPHGALDKSPFMRVELVTREEADDGDCASRAERSTPLPHSQSTRESGAPPDRALCAAASALHRQSDSASTPHRRGAGSIDALATSQNSARRWCDRGRVRRRGDLLYAEPAQPGLAARTVDRSGVLTAS